VPSPIQRKKGDEKIGQKGGSRYPYPCTDKFCEWCTNWGRRRLKWEKIKKEMIREMKEEEK